MERNKQAAKDKRLMSALGKILRDHRGGDARFASSAASTQEEIADKLGVSQNYLSRVERGLNKLPLHRLLDVADAYCIPVEEIASKLATLTKHKSIC